MSSDAVFYQTEDHILQRRRELSNAFSALRRVHPRVPFFKLAVHRVPTLWSLYRGLLREAPSDNIRWRMRLLFERYKSLTSATQTHEKLQMGHKYLRIFISANSGNQRHQLVTARYDLMIKAKRDKERIKGLIRKELQWQDRLRNRPIMTGAYLRPSYFNGPLPRLKPQPLRISMMMKRRIRAREHRLAKYEAQGENIRDLNNERNFEEHLYKSTAGTSEQAFEPVFQKASDWNEETIATRSLIRRQLDADSERHAQPYPPALLSQIADARRGRALNQAREAERERRGETVPRLVRRRRQGPPAHILAKMSAEQRRADRIVRSVSEVGYVGLTKSRLRRGMRNPGRWVELEEGKKENRGMLDSVAEEILRENGRRSGPENAE